MHMILDDKGFWDVVKPQQLCCPSLQVLYPDKFKSQGGVHTQQLYNFTTIFIIWKSISSYRDKI